MKLAPSAARNFGPYCWVRLTACVCAIVGGLPAAAEAPKFAAALAECQDCHGERGLSRNSDTPHLAGQLPGYLVEAMRALQKERWGTSIVDHVPPGHALGLLEELAAYFAAQPPAEEPEPADAATMERGHRVYEARCSVCHEDHGRESDRRGLGAPRLAGQRSAYLIIQLRDFLAGRRPFRSYIMAQAYTGLSAQELEDVARFFAAQSSQPPVEPQPESAGKRRKAPRGTVAPK